MIWDSADKKIEEEIDKSQTEIIKLMEKLMEEKMLKIIEINQKYELELKDLEADIDISKLKLKLILNKL